MDKKEREIFTRYMDASYKVHLYNKCHKDRFFKLLPRESKMDKFPEYNRSFTERGDESDEFLEKFRRARDNTKFKPPVKNTQNADRFFVVCLVAVAILMVFSIIGLVIRFGS